MRRTKDIEREWKPVAGERAGVEFAVDGLLVYVRVPDRYFAYLEFGPVAVVGNNVAFTVSQMLLELRRLN